jgi:hypothetical protein
VYSDAFRPATQIGTFRDHLLHDQQARQLSVGCRAVLDRDLAAQKSGKIAAK